MYEVVTIVRRETHTHTHTHTSKLLKAPWLEQWNGVAVLLPPPRCALMAGVSRLCRSNSILALLCNLCTPQRMCVYFLKYKKSVVYVHVASDACGRMCFKFKNLFVHLRGNFNFDELALLPQPRQVRRQSGMISVNCTKHYRK